MTPTPSLVLTRKRDGVASDCVVNFYVIHTLPRAEFHLHLTTLPAPRMAGACWAPRAALAC